jgi:very-short-patch-repair endonuclease
MSGAVDAMLWQLRAAKAPTPVTEHRFHPVRKWRFDMAWIEDRVAVEVDGGAWVGGRHVSGQGFEDDCEKLSWAAALGWRVLRVTPRMITGGQALILIELALGLRDGP